MPARTRDEDRKFASLVWAQRRSNPPENGCFRPRQRQTQFLKNVATAALARNFPIPVLGYTHSRTGSHKGCRRRDVERIGPVAACSAGIEQRFFQLINVDREAYFPHGFSEAHNFSDGLALVPEKHEDLGDFVAGDGRAVWVVDDEAKMVVGASFAPANRDTGSWMSLTRTLLSFSSSLRSFFTTLRCCR